MSEAPYDPNLRRDTPLSAKLSARIRRDGPISVAAYMQACLQDAEHGYYRGKAAIGRSGDFITAPEVSQVFGELIGLWCAVVWQQMGEPGAFDLIELGPGRGTLMADALRATRIVKGFRDAAHVTLVETNPVLRLAQADALHQQSVTPTWTDTLAGPTRPAIVVGNEFLDTAAISQHVLTEDGWRERVVTVDDAGHLQFSLRTGAAPANGPNSMARNAEGAWSDPAPLGAIVEARVDPLPDWLTATRDAPLAALLIDYGHTEPQLGETLQAVRAHAFEHPLTSPGEADLSCQVDFSAVAEAIRPALAIDGPTTQAEFLGGLGIVQRASRLMAANPTRSNAIEIGIARLMNPQGMGGRFKVLGARSHGLPPLPGFQTRAP